MFLCLICVLNLFVPCVLSAGDIAKAKCEEYAKYVNTVEDSPVLTASAGKNTVSQCGIVEVPLIVGGEKASPKEFPHMAVIGFGKSASDELSWMCGGTLISEKYILTAAHCLESVEKGPAQKVRLGELNLASTDDETKTQEIGILKKIPHPDYKRPARYHDIALLELDSPVDFDAYVRPACLQVNKDIPGKMAIATGFGKLSFDTTVGSKELMKVQLSYIDKDTCAINFKKDVIGLKDGITDGLLCAGELAGGKDTCQGDSGGPLQIVLEKPYCMYSVVGVTSFGKFCGFENSPAIYSRLSYYVDWIEKTVWS